MQLKTATPTGKKSTLFIYKEKRIYMQENQYLTIEEVAKILRQSAATIRCDITRNKTNKLPPYLRFGARILFPVNELHSWLHSKIVYKNNVNVNDTKFIDHAHLNSVNKKRPGRPLKKSLNSGVTK